MDRSMWGTESSAEECVWQFCPVWFDVSVDHSTWPVWRHQGHRQISCPLMSACRRIQQVKGNLWHSFAFIHLFFPHSFWLALSLLVCLCFCSVVSPSLPSSSRRLFISHSVPYLFMSVCFFSKLLFPVEHCRYTVWFFCQCWLHFCCSSDSLVVAS